VFETEKATFARELPRLLTAAPDQFALVKGERVSWWETEADAVRAGHQLYPGQPFYRRITAEPEQAALLNRVPCGLV
jgi:hypothetical protein